MRTSPYLHFKPTLPEFYWVRWAVGTVRGDIASLRFYEAEFDHRRFTNRLRLTVLLRETVGSMAERSRHV